MLFFFIIAFSGCTNPVSTDYFSEDISPTEQSILQVKTINGNLELSSWTEDNITIDGVKKSRFGQEDLDKIELVINDVDNLIQIEAKYTGTRLSTPIVDMNIKIPSFVTVEEVTTSNGAIQISELKGNITATSSNGAIIIDDVDGFVSALTSNGKIEVTDTKGIIDLMSSNGEVTAEISHIINDISITTSNGRINLYINQSLDADVDFQTSNGNINTNGLTLNLTSSSSKHMAGKLGNGGLLIYVHTSNGNININKL